MADVLVDTSVWIDFFRSTKGKAGDLLDDLLAQDRVALCGIVEMEIFQGLKPRELKEIRSIFEVIPYIETTREDFIESGRRWQQLRKKGKTIPPTDCLIAQLCIRHGLRLLTLDSHFNVIKNVKRVKG